MASQEIGRCECHKDIESWIDLVCRNFSVTYVTLDYARIM